MKPQKPLPSAHELERSVTLPLLVLYGLGVTIGAGIYVLVGTTTARAGIYAPVSFLLAAVVMAFSAGSFAEFTSRIPQSAGEAAYVDAGFGARWLTLATGGAVVVSASVAAAAISLGCAGYLGVLIPLPLPALAAIVVLLMGCIAAWGIKESVTFAAVLTLIEVIGLLIIVIAGIATNPDIFSKIGSVFPSLDDTPALTGIFGASLLAFFAFIGFDDVVNLVEETKNPKRTLPLAIMISLILVTIIYFLVVFVAVQSVSLSDLSVSQAPIRLLFERLTDIPPLTITLIAIVATLNGIIIQIIMASRVLYGLGKKGQIPAVLAVVNPTTHTPLNATILVTASVLILTLFVPLQSLAELTSQIVLSVFGMVNLALIRVKLRKDAHPEDIFLVPIWVPFFGAVACLILLSGSFILD